MAAHIMTTPMNNDQTVSIPLSQYVDSIVALQKLDDIRKIVCDEDLDYYDYATPILQAIKAIVSVHKESDSCLMIKGGEDVSVLK